jgi:hypothetical protein
VSAPGDETLRRLASGEAPLSDEATHAAWRAAEVLRLRAENAEMRGVCDDLHIDARRATDERDALRAVIEGRTTPPTPEENATHLAAGGAWLVAWQWREGVPVAEIAWGKHVCGDDRPKGARWIALDAERRPCQWPEVAR